MAYNYYDGASCQALTSFCLWLRSFRPRRRSMTIPNQQPWQRRFFVRLDNSNSAGLSGEPAITRNCGLSTISRTSYGSSAFAFNPADLDNKNPGSLNTFQCIIQKRTARSAIGGVAYDPATQRIFPTSLSSEHQGRIL